MRVLVACEESQEVCAAFRARGHEAFSCDMQPCRFTDHPEWHIMEDALLVIRGGGAFTTMDLRQHEIPAWDLIIAHPPCTYLSNVCTRGFSLKATPAAKVVDRWIERAKAAVFFMEFIAADAPRICVENPIGFMNTAYRQPDQIIHPYMFVQDAGDPDYVTKATCLWLKGLEPLKTNDLPRPNNRELHGCYSNGKSKTWEDMIKTDRQKNRSRTFHGVALAMAEQWG